MRPVIGITCGTSDLDKYDNLVWNNYILAIENAEGTPIIIPLAKSESSYGHFIKIIDGLLLSGGVDINPSIYAETPHKEIGRIDKYRDQIEIYLTIRALKYNIPIFGICRGIQTLNVSAGGTLYQDIPSEFADALEHRQTKPWSEGTHTIDIKKGSRLLEIMGQPKANVNSFHHQAIKDVASDFAVSAVASDGVIEGIESIKHPYAIGVQFHPERMWQNNPAITALFTSFVNSAKSYKMRK